MRTVYLGTSEFAATVLERLESLRQWSGMTDEEVITRAEQGTLPGDPPYAEWLVLLGRGDLLGK